MTHTRDLEGIEETKEEPDLLAEAGDVVRPMSPLSGSGSPLSGSKAQKVSQHIKVSQLRKMRRSESVRESERDERLRETAKIHAGACAELKLSRWIQMSLPVKRAFR